MTTEGILVLIGTLLVLCIVAIGLVSIFSRRWKIRLVVGLPVGILLTAGLWLGAYMLFLEEEKNEARLKAIDEELAAREAEQQQPASQAGFSPMPYVEETSDYSSSAESDAVLKGIRSLSYIGLPYRLSFTKPEASGDIPADIAGADADATEEDLSALFFSAEVPEYIGLSDYNFVGLLPDSSENYYVVWTASISDTNNPTGHKRPFLTIIQRDGSTVWSGDISANSNYNDMCVEEATDEISIDLDWHIRSTYIGQSGCTDDYDGKIDRTLKIEGTSVMEVEYVEH